VISVLSDDISNDFADLDVENGMLLAHQSHCLCTNLDKVFFYICSHIV